MGEFFFVEMKQFGWMIYRDDDDDDDDDDGDIKGHSGTVKKGCIFVGRCLYQKIGKRGMFA